MKDGILVPKDLRGSHLNRLRMLSFEDRNKIMVHINNFPIMENHYSRKDSGKKCLSMDLSVKKMYRMFVEENPESHVNYCFYRKVFNRDFNLRFGSPRSDTCKTCDENYAKLVLARDQEARQIIVNESQLHHMKADVAYKELAENGRDPNYVTLCMDLQQVLFSPTLTHSHVYYQRQYSTYNFNIHNMSTNKANMYLWHETVAKRGSKEIGSCILKYVQSMFPILRSGEKRQLILWSDRCVGQNNNKTILSLMKYFINCGYFTEVHQKFLVSGHSFLPCDRDFALIERQRKFKKAIVPSDWKYVIAASKVNEPFNITEMEQDDFKNMDKIVSNYMVHDSAFQITKYVWYKFTSDDPSSVHARESYNTVRPWKVFELFKSSVPTEINLPRLYSGPIPITKEKKKDLVHMTSFMSNQSHKDFYLNLHSQ